MALLSSDMIREIRAVAQEYSRQEANRRERAAESLAQKGRCKDCGIVDVDFDALHDTARCSKCWGFVAPLSGDAA